MQILDARSIGSRDNRPGSSLGTGECLFGDGWCTGLTHRLIVTIGPPLIFHYDTMHVGNEDVGARDGYVRVYRELSLRVNG